MNNEDRLRNELEQLLYVIDDQQAEIDSLRNQIDEVTELVILLMHNVKMR